ncbi:MAG: STAS domain-containing protein [Elainella sp. Prado103]|nr:STAS domain-containing protein [Elainella sp. Prado103]
MQNSSFITPGTTMIQPQGHINAANAAVLQQQLAETVAEQGCDSLWVDMSQVESLDSAGLMALVSTLTLAQRLNKRFGLCGVSPSVRIVFELTQLDRVFEILDGQRIPELYETAAA